LINIDALNEISKVWVNRILYMQKKHLFSSHQLMVLNAISM